MNTYNATNIRPSYAIAESQAGLLRSVFGWMTLGLILTGLVATFVLNTPAITQSLLSPGVLIVLMFAELGLVFWLSARVMKMSATKATSLFLLYSALNGVTLAPLALAYTGESIASAFLVSGALFGGMALFGYVTKRDLSGWGSFLYMGLLGIILASIVSFFFQSGLMSFMIQIAGVIVFTGLTAHHVQNVKEMGASMDFSQGDASFRRVSILSALTLYLSLINMFIFILQLIGSRD